MKRVVVFGLLLAAMVGWRPQLHAQATLLLEEPYSYDGAFAGTGHSAVYLSRVCAESPVVLRRCKPGEMGIVISRYHGIAGYDWIAVPLIPYLYAVEKPDSVPLYADTKLVAFLRAQYLAKVKAALLEDAESAPRAPWYELAGSAYDRTLYGFQIETTPEQDDALIRKLNSAPNREAYNLLKRNCADFVREIINFYYPKAVHRSVIEDLGVTTPKQAAKMLVRSSERRPEMELQSFIIPQVPGTKRSKPLHGVLDSVLLAKKYMMPLALLHPVMVGGAEAAYWLGWRFHPPQDAPVFDAMRGLETPLPTEQRQAYERLLNDVRRSEFETEPAPAEWARLQAAAEPGLDGAGHPLLQVQYGGKTVEVGLCRANVLPAAAPELVQQLLFTRLRLQLKGGSPVRASEKEIATGWGLLQEALSSEPRRTAGEIAGK